jgi:uncharacterized protein
VQHSYQRRTGLFSVIVVILHEPFTKYMKRSATFFFLLVLFVLACKQKDAKIATNENSLLWKISGNGLKRPSYIYGTVHIICSEDALLSDDFKKIIKNSDEVYFEVDLDNIEEMFSILDKMKMRGDTTLEDLLSGSDFEKVKNFIEENSPLLPFSELKTYLPILVSALLVEEVMTCKEKTGIEEVIQEVAEKYKKPIEGIETLKYQLSITDSIPYAEQAKELVTFIDSASNKGWMKAEIDKFYNAYNEQDLEKLLEMTSKMDSSLIKFGDLLLYNRNRNWVVELKKLLPKKSLVLAVGAGHLPGKNGVIDLLRKEGYEVTPVENNISRKKK